VLKERATPGLHDRAESLLSSFPPGRALDLGAGTGAFAERLRSQGWEVVASDLLPEGYRGSSPFVSADLDQPGWESAFSGPFDLVVAIEVLEHLRNPGIFFDGVSRLLHPEGVFLLTTPNVESGIARLRYALRGTLRFFDRFSDPTHRFPVFSYLLEEQWLNPKGLFIKAHITYPGRGTLHTRTLVRLPALILSSLFPAHPPWQGDNHLFLIGKIPARD
jgi:2-polyprenyl-3-methyl-5-hydroxy-6-metoxy-1,4-benzoquinol methylase